MGSRGGYARNAVVGTGEVRTLSQMRKTLSDSPFGEAPRVHFLRTLDRRQH